ncbi:hypothetical protein BDU57DRAFT_402746, partial [Ampelomyces quisqualis]
SVLDLSFEEYKAAHLNINEQHALIGRIRDEVPLADRDEIDGFLLMEAAKQLELCVFPMCKMMHVDPKAVKKMLDDQFRKAYGLDVEDETTRNLQKSTMAPGGVVGAVGVKDDIPMAGSSVESQVEDKDALADEPAKKKLKRAEKSAVQKELKAYQVKKKRGRKECFILALKSKVVAEKWAALTT